MKVLAIDAGNIQSCYVLFCTEEKKVIKKGLVENEAFLKEILTLKFDEVAIEKIVSMGMAVGDTTFETVFQNARIYQILLDKLNIKANFYPRYDIKMHLCMTTRAKDGNIRAALVNKFGEPSTKKNPHNTYSELDDGVYFGTHFWAALAVCMYHIEPHHSKPIQTDGYGTFLKN